MDPFLKSRRKIQEEEMMRGRRMDPRMDPDYYRKHMEKGRGMSNYFFNYFIQVLLYNDLVKFIVKDEL